MNVLWRWQLTLNNHRPGPHLWSYKGNSIAHSLHTVAIILVMPQSATTICPSITVALQSLINPKRNILIVLFYFPFIQIHELRRKNNGSLFLSGQFLQMLHLKTNCSSAVFNRKVWRQEKSKQENRQAGCIVGEIRGRNREQCCTSPFNVKT